MADAEQTRCQEEIPAELIPNRRETERQPFGQWPLVRFLAKPSFQPQVGIIQNLSRKGIALVVTNRLETGTLLAIRLRRADVGVTGILSAHVKHATPLPDDHWLVGCRLNRSLSDQEIRALLEEGSSENMLF